MVTKNKEEIVDIIAKSEKDRISRAEKVNNLFLKYKKWFRENYETVDFKEPVMQLIRNNGAVEFFEGATAGLFEYKHSDGEKRFIVLNPSKQLKFGFAKKMFKGYICHEDYPLPLPQDPYITSEQVNIIVEKSLHDVKQWKAKELKARGDLWWKVLLGVAIIIGALALYKMLVTGNAPPPQVIRETAVQVIQQNATIL